MDKKTKLIDDVLTNEVEEEIWEESRKANIKEAAFQEINSKLKESAENFHNLNDAIGSHFSSTDDRILKIEESVRELRESVRELQESFVCFVAADLKAAGLDPHHGELAGDQLKDFYRESAEIHLSDVLQRYAIAPLKSVDSPVGTLFKLRQTKKDDKHPWPQLSLNRLIDEEFKKSERGKKDTYFKRKSDDAIPEWDRAFPDEPI